MSDLPLVSAGQAIRAFGKIGFFVARQNGSHCTLKKEGHRLLLTVPIHGNRELKKGLLRSLIKNADITEQEFIELLNS